MCALLKREGEGLLYRICTFLDCTVVLLVPLPFEVKSAGWMEGKLLTALHKHGWNLCNRLVNQSTPRWYCHVHRFT